MARRILLGMAGGLLLLGSGAARAQSSEVRDRVVPPAPLAGEWYVGPHVGYSFIGKYDKVYCPCDTDQNDFLFPGARLGHFFSDHFAIEATAQYFHPDRDRIHEFWELTLGGQYDFTPSIPGWNTYVGFGGGASRQDVFKGKGVALAYLAAGSEYRFSKLVGLRLEVKGQYNFSSRFTDQNAFGSFSVENPSHVDIQPTIGVLFHFGGHAAPAVVEVPPAPAPARRPRPLHPRPRRSPSAPRRRRSFRRLPLRQGPSATRSTSITARAASPTSPRRSSTRSRCACATIRARPSRSWATRTRARARARRLLAAPARRERQAIPDRPARHRRRAHHDEDRHDRYRQPHAGRDHHDDALTWRVEIRSGSSPRRPSE